ncbi:N5-glutamine methyltransferase MTQ2 [Trypanosoma conorhini]|uniref:N5-glutamine methyltransferase MTQ2 n=1 Tax=Trypanosoma conorhini TaxID=83891 RepID=A0A3R7N8R5_9TRYP|nr:N5-glutamine methyltransferase MTQ2 [Trypanosoma conorhini]RNF27287.1 N5-glutamine methyltransferase MTQ2 [Trypanosoma conorhini]
MTATPDYFHCIREPRFRANVYEPEADTFLLLETLDKDADLLRALRPRRCVEIGCGSGTVITHLQLVLAGASGGASGAQEERRLSSNSGSAWRVQCHAVDINPVALEATSITWRTSLQRLWGAAAPPLQLHHGDLFAPFQRDCTEGRRAAAAADFDVILFNPPYVPTSAEELESAGKEGSFIAAAWCGGPRGRVVVDRFVAQLPRFLSAGGVCYIVAIAQNDVPGLMETIRAAFAGAAQAAAEAVVEVAVAAERYTGEQLKVIRVQRGARHNS